MNTQIQVGDKFVNRYNGEILEVVADLSDEAIRKVRVICNGFSDRAFTIRMEDISRFHDPVKSQCTCADFDGFVDCPAHI